MKKTIALAAVALMCGTSVYAQTTSPDQTTTDQQSNTQVHGQPTIEPSAGGAVSSTEAGKAGQDSSTGATMSTGTTGAGSTSTTEPAPSSSTTTDTGTSSTTTDTGTSSTTSGTTSTGSDMSTGTSSTSTGSDMSASSSAGAAGGANLAQFDANNDGSLTPLEFGQLVMSTRAPASGNSGLAAEAKRERYSKAAGNGAIKLLNETARDFGMADKNMDKRVDSSELAMWQSGGSPTM